MKDQADTQTAEIFLVTKRGRGRPSTGQAKSNAERQKAYRARCKLNAIAKAVTGQGVTESEYLSRIADLKSALMVSESREKLLNQEMDAVKEQLRQAHAEIAALQKQLEKRNVTTNPAYEIDPGFYDPENFESKQVRYHSKSGRVYYRGRWIASTHGADINFFHKKAGSVFRMYVIQTIDKRIKAKG